jgi:V/A-type H+/Na+-transporting ATPase subunit A
LEQSKVKEMPQATVKKISGPLVIGVGLEGSKMYELVHVGREKLFGEIIEIKGAECSIQVYENTEGVTPGDPIEPTGAPLSVELGPGLIKSIYDGVQRPLDKLRALQGDFILRGAQAPALDREKQWHFTPVAKPGQDVAEGDVLGDVQESHMILHRIMAPPGMKGRVTDIRELDGTVETTIATLATDAGEVKLNMIQRWPVRRPRPIRKRLTPDRPLVTGQRILDMLFPLAKGGTACVPGPFGSGKTVVQHQLARWADAQVVVYVGCGERGNEMTDVLTSFPELVDPRSGRPLMERTVLIANTSNMPVAAREVSIYTGITIAEYYRDMGYHVAVMADSTSRWAEALRELAARLEEMPAEEGFPANLPSKLAGFYERAGCVRTLSGKDASVSIVGSVSPPGGDMSEPVTQHTRRFIRCYWALDTLLANARHYPAIHWLHSYSEYVPEVAAWWENVDPEWLRLRQQAMELLQREDRLQQIVKLVGPDVLPDSQRLVLFVAELLKNGFLQQSAFDPIDTYSSPEKQVFLLRLILTVYNRGLEYINRGGTLVKIRELPVMQDITRARSALRDKDREGFDALRRGLVDAFDALEREMVR